MTELSLTTITLVATTKIILLGALVVVAILLWRRAKPWTYLALASVSLASFGFVLLWPLQTMWWGNNGDEMFIGAFFTQVIQGSLWQDFYYAGLPPFYPPLYFWVIGSIAKLFTLSTISAFKVGVVATLLGWFTLPYVFSRIASREHEADQPETSPWFWLLVPTLFLLLLDFDTIIVKPYETLPALLSALFLVYVSVKLQAPKWTTYEYALFGITGGILFLTYYFWWFIAVPALVIIALLGKTKKVSLIRVARIGGMTGLLSLPYTLPLARSLIVRGMESWQARYFVPSDFSTFMPWGTLDARGLLLVAGLVACVVYFRRPFVRGAVVGLAIAYLYQVLNIGAYLVGLSPAQSAKPFLFLGTAFLAVTASYGFMELYRHVSIHRGKIFAVRATIILSLVLLPLTPFVKFIDDPVAQGQIEKDLAPSTAADFATLLEKAVPDYANRTWMTSGAPHLNLYIPIHYFIAFNPHFSHPASQYSERYAYVQKMVATESPDAFTRLADEADPQIDSLLLYNDSSTNSFPLFFWQDTFPNGGKESRLDLSPSLLKPDDWELRVTSGEWNIFIRKLDKTGEHGI